MKTPRLYVDTSVIGGVFDEEFADDSQRLFDAVRAGRAVVLVSETTERELQPAPARVQEVLLSLPTFALQRLVPAEDVSGLTAAYLEANVVSQRYRDDASHIAYATVYDADVLVSWNFRHIVNLGRIRAFNAVNMMHGYRTLEIRSPRELFFPEDDGEA